MSGGDIINQRKQAGQVMTDENSFLVNQFNSSSIPFSEVDLQKIYEEFDLYNKEVGALMSQGAYGEDGVLAGGIRSRLGSLEIKRKKEEEENFIEFLWEQILRNAIDRINEIIAYHKEQMRLLLEKIEFQRIQWHDLQKQKNALKDVIDKYRNEGVIELDEIGVLKNKRAEEALKTYEKQTGITIDRNDPNLYLILLEAQKSLENQQESLQAKIRGNEKAYEAHKEKLEEAERIKDDLTSGDELRQRKGLEQLNSLDHDQQIATAINALERIDDPTQEQIVMDVAGLTTEDLEMNDFSFDFPPLRNDFNKSVEVNEKTTEKQKPSLQVNNLITPPKL